MGQTERIGNTAGLDTSNHGVNRMNTCNMSTYSDSANIPNPSVNLCNYNVNAGSGLYANRTDLKRTNSSDIHGQYKYPFISSGTLIYTSP